MNSLSVAASATYQQLLQQQQQHRNQMNPFLFLPHLSETNVKSEVDVEDDNVSGEENLFNQLKNHQKVSNTEFEKTLIYK